MEQQLGESCHHFALQCLLQGCRRILGPQSTPSKFSQHKNVENSEAQDIEPSIIPLFLGFPHCQEGLDEPTQVKILLCMRLRACEGGRSNSSTKRKKSELGL